MIGSPEIEMRDLLAGEALTRLDETHYVQAYLPLVHRVVKQLSRQVSSVIDREDMQQIALMGLLSSLRRYGRPDGQFAAYASLRIRGAILDELRQLDWRPRRLRQRSHKIHDAIRQLERELGRTPDFTELSEQLSITAQEYQQYLLLDCAKALESLDDLLRKGQENTALNSRNLEEQILISRTLRAALASLDQREQLILALYYQHEMSLMEIAKTLDLTEARVCQLKKGIVQKIQVFFGSEA